MDRRFSDVCLALGATESFLPGALAAHPEGVVLPREHDGRNRPGSRCGRSWTRTPRSWSVSATCPRPRRSCGTTGNQLSRAVDRGPGVRLSEAR